MPSQTDINANDREETEHQAFMNILDNRNPSAAEPENELVLPNFTDKAEHQAICVSILSLAKSVGYKNSLEKGKRQIFF